MKKIFAAVAAVMAFSNGLQAQAYTWSENTACIFYTNCTKCHFPGGPGPFSLIDYASAYTARFAIKAAVSTNYMPPWPPDETYQTYAHERLLTAQEKNIIIAWVDSGALEGNTALAPPPPPYSTSGSQLSSIDFTGSIGTYTNTFTLDEYRCFIIPTSYATDQYITDLEIVPGNRNMVHHVLVFQDTSPSVLSLDTADPGNGYTSFGGTGSTTSKLLGGWVPGSQPTTYPAGMGMKLDAGAYIILQIHYPQGTNGDTDSTRINLKFSSGSLRSVSFSPILSHTTNISPPLAIPPLTSMTFTETYTIPSFTPGADNVTVLSVAPHMHTVARNIICYAIKPGNDTVPLISIPNWDFKWQGIYNFRQPLVLPEGTVIRAEALFDNTPANPNAPNPNNWVYAGEATEDEMMMVYFAYLPYQNGDENIIVDTSTIKPTYNGCTFVGLESENGSLADFNLYPNPSAGSFRLSFEQPAKADVMIRAIDITGKVVSEWLLPGIEAGLYQRDLQLENIPDGIYYVQVYSGLYATTRPVVIIKP